MSAPRFCASTVAEQLACFLLVCVTLLSSCTSQNITAKPWRAVELSCSVYITGDWDFSNIGNETNWASRCTDMVQRVKDRCGGKRINFIPTHYWVDTTGAYIPDYFCYKFSVLDGSKPGGDCREPTQMEIDQYTNNMATCFSRAVQLGYDVEITPHLDDATDKGQWRNMLNFDPMQRYGQWSYYDVMINPLTTAVGGVMRSGTKVYLAMQGEMSYTVIKYPTSYSYMASLFIKPKPTSGSVGNTKVGVSLNFEKLLGAAQITNTTLNTTGVDATAVQQLFNQMDFIGVAGYSGWQTGLDINLSDLENAAKAFIEEIQWLGVDLPALVNEQGKEFHLSEYGLGGGLCANGTCPARNAVQAGVTPYLGIYGYYNKSTDPWAARVTQQVQAKFYDLSLEWLATGGGPTVRVDAVYLWAQSSWDVAGIHPDSYGLNGTYWNENITTNIRTHNSKVAAGMLWNPSPPNPPLQSPPPPGTRTPTSFPPPPLSIAPFAPPMGGPSLGRNDSNNGNISLPSTGSGKKDGGKGVGTIAAVVAGATVGAFVLAGLAIFVTRKLTGGHDGKDLDAPDSVVIFAQ